MTNRTIKRVNILINDFCSSMWFPSFILVVDENSMTKLKIGAELMIETARTDVRLDAIEEFLAELSNIHNLSKFLDKKYLVKYYIINVISKDVCYIQNYRGTGYILKIDAKDCMKKYERFNIVDDVVAQSSRIFPCRFFFKPTFFVIDLTYKCNLNCIYCVRKRFNYNKNNSNISKQILTKIVELIKQAVDKFNLDRVYIQPYGGEPTLYNELIFYLDDLLNTTIGKGKYKIVLETNGIGITPDIAHEFYRRGIGIGLSIDGPENVHDMQRGRGSYRVVVNALNNLINAGYKMEEIGVISVITKYSIDKLDTIVNHLINELGFTIVHLNYPIHSSDNVRPQIEIYAREIVRVFTELINNNKNIKIRPLTELIFSMFIGHSHSVCYQYDGCYAGMSMLSFDIHGNIYPCPELVGLSEYALGNINRISGIEDIKKRSANFRKKVCYSFKELIPGKGYGCIAFHKRIGTTDQVNMYSTLFKELIIKIANDTKFRYNLEQYLANALNRYYRNLDSNS